MKHPTEEEFEAWRDHPITKWVMAACKRAADDNKQLWVKQSWEAGKCDELALVELRTRADAYLALAETEYVAWLAEHEVEEK